jgi:N-acetylmuramoyl-L-alanine amidase
MLALLAIAAIPALSGCAESQDTPTASVAAQATARGATAHALRAHRRQTPAPRIIKRFIPYGLQRKHEMREYALRHYGIDSYHLSDPRLIVEHYTETPDFQSTFNTFASDTPDSEYHELPNTCAHFVVDRNGAIYQLVPLGLMCRHVVGINYTAIGIENVGYSDAQILDDPRQLRSSLRLTAWLRCKLHLAVRNVIGHNESLTSPYYRELVPAFRGRTHSDFTRADMNTYRSKLAHLGCA